MTSESRDPLVDDAQNLRDLLGYLNFSDGAPAAGFQRSLNALFSTESAPTDCPALLRTLQAAIDQLAESGESAFGDTRRAKSCLNVTLTHVFPAYLRHHQDLLFHLSEADLFQPFFLVKTFEAVLAAAVEAGWNDIDTLVSEALGRLNSFVGYRPVALLENERRMEVYDHERFCPIPLFLKDAGTAVGPYQALIEATLKFVRKLPAHMTEPAHFSLDRLDELSLDVRAHDHLHPVNKRTNYMFGEWDPETIDTRGFYRRFVIRKIILDSLLDWMTSDTEMPFEERLFDASAVLAGTILMASAISGSGPDTFDSSTSLTSLLPMVARQRDHFYQRLIESAKGQRRIRLEKQANESRQPFGHVRHQLNMNLSRYGASQVQHRHLSWLYASMGFTSASHDEAHVIPCPSARFESGLQSKLMLIRREVRNENLAAASRELTESLDLFQRGIRCGAQVDPWNILGFQGMFPLFFAREDSIPDNRVEVLMELVEQIFDGCSVIMAAAAAAGAMEVRDYVRIQFAAIAEQWDAYATTTVSDLPAIHGVESLKAAEHVASALADWRTAGEAAGDISFWRNHVDQFESARSFSQVVSALLDRSDIVAAMGLLMQWLGEAESVGIEAGRHSIHNQLHRLLQAIVRTDDRTEQWSMLRRLFAFMESNAGAYWIVPSLQEFASRQTDSDSGETDESGLDFDHLFEEDENSADEDLFQAAYDDVVFRDSADDGNAADTVDEGYGPGTTEFEMLYRQIEPRLKFLHTVGSLWSKAAVALSRHAHDECAPKQQADLREWLSTIRGFLSRLGELVTEVRDYEISIYSSDLEANIEYDIQMQSRFLLMQNAISTTVEFLMAERLLCAVLEDAPGASSGGRAFDQKLIGMLRAVLSEDVENVKSSFPEFCETLRRRPLLYVPFEHGGQPTSILKARTLQAIIRLLLTQLPRLGLLEETFRLLQTAYRMERTSRPLGQAVTEFDRLFRIGLSNSVGTILQASRRWKTASSRQQRELYRRVQRLMIVYRELWGTHSNSMRLSIVEELHDEDRATEIRDFIEEFGEDLFHTRMLTLGNARAIVHNGADDLLDELQQNAATFQKVAIVDALEEGKIDREDAAEMMEFVYESVVDNFDTFLEYNTTTTHSDYGNQLYCLLDFLRLEAAYDRFEWNNIPYQVVHEVIVRFGSQELAAEVESELAEETRHTAETLVEELHELESAYGVRLPTLHDRISERIIGTLTVNRMAARVPRCCPDLTDVTQEEAETEFEALRLEVTDYMETRIGSGIEPPSWMLHLTRELDRVQDEQSGLATEALHGGEFKHVTQRELDRQLARLLDDEL